jgi:hypothetical protein
MTDGEAMKTARQEMMDLFTSMICDIAGVALYFRMVRPVKPIPCMKQEVFHE